jgi:hypothetical protein
LSQTPWVGSLADDSTPVTRNKEGQDETMARRKDSVPMAKTPDTVACSRCGHTNSTASVKTVRVDLRPVLTREVFAFPDALAEVTCLKCARCGYWVCLDYRIELDDNPEIDLNPE